MTEEVWLAAEDGEQVYAMLGHLWEMPFPWDITKRFLVACCRRVEEFVTSSAGRSVLDNLEQRSSYLWNPERLQEARHATAEASRVWASAATLHEQAFHFAEYAVNHLIRGLESDTVSHCARVAAIRKLMAEEGEDAECHWGLESDLEEGLAQLHLLRCIVGNPFRPVAFAPEWQTEHTTGLAARMYDERNFDAMPILADALEEAGCDNRAMLDHCREPGLHARGCWVVDGVLGKR